MKFKIDENLPTEFAEILQEFGYDAMTVHQQKLKGEKDPILLEICQQESRILITLDLDFANIRNYPPEQFLGIIVFRVSRQDKPYLLSILQNIIPLFGQEKIVHRLWIVEEKRLRIRGEI
jgi:predicted nuclease of predicted toxin-antitoxin system